MIKFCHITPVPYLTSFAHLNGAHLILAHLVEENEQYRSFYANLNDGKPKIMDNSAFEMFKLGKDMYPSSKLVTLGKMVNANYIVMTDYPKEPWVKTVEKAKEMIPELIGNGFKTFFCPQSELRDMDGLLKSIEWGLQQNVDLIGISILSCPIACGVNETKHSDGKRDDAYKLQRFLSRWKVFAEMERKGITKYANKKFHCLGMMDGPNEIELLRPWHDTIFSWDSSAGVWAGLNGIRFDNSPSGLMGGKYEKEVNFEYNKNSIDNFNNVVYNCTYINNMTIPRARLL